MNSKFAKVRKALAKHVSTKGFLKIAIWNRHFTLTYFYDKYDTRISSWYIWNDDSTKMIILPSFQFAIRLNLQNPYETQIHNVFTHINLYLSTGISNCNFQVWTPRKWCFEFISVQYTITDYQTPETLWYTTRGAKWSDVKNVLFSFAKYEKWTSAET